MASNATREEPQKNFNEETAWDGRQNLFDVYFAKIIDTKKHYIVYLDTKESDFEKAVSDLKTKYDALTP